MNRRTKVSIQIALASLTVQSGEAFALPLLEQLPTAQLSPVMLKSIEANYCKDIQKSNEFIHQINDLHLKNNRGLTVGSFVDYVIQVTRTDSITKKIIENYELTERWKVIELNADTATVEITQNNSNKEIKTISLNEKIYRQRVQKSDPMSCFYWSYFAEKFGKESLVAFNKTTNTLVRSQAKLGNIAPVFYYGKDVPFSIVKYLEKIDFGKTTVVRNKIAKRYSF